MIVLISLLVLTVVAYTILTEIDIKNAEKFLKEYEEIERNKITVIFNPIDNDLEKYYCYNVKENLKWKHGKNLQFWLSV